MLLKCNFYSALCYITKIYVKNVVGPIDGVKLNAFIVKRAEQGLF